MTKKVEQSKKKYTDEEIEEALDMPREDSLDALLKKFKDEIEKSPLMAIAVAFAIGLAIGAAMSKSK